MSDLKPIYVDSIQVRRGLEIELAGAPTSVEPLVLSDGLNEGEFGMTVDSGRLFIGHKPKLGDVNYRRAEFPYQNLEVLTENSPRLRQIYSEMERDNGANTFFPPIYIPSYANYETLDVAGSGYNESDINPSIFNIHGGTVSFDYLLFEGVSTEEGADPMTAGRALLSGTQNFILNGDNISRSDDNPAYGMDFTDSYYFYLDIEHHGQSSDEQNRPYRYRLVVDCDLPSDCILYIRRTVVRSWYSIQVEDNNEH